MTNPRGRPKTRTLDRFRVMFWSHCVLEASGKTSAVELEALFSRATGKIRLAQGTWSRYMRGNITPQGARNEEVLSLVQRLDVMYPGTAKVFQHPIWLLLDFRAWLGPQELKLMYVDMGEVDLLEFLGPHCVAPTDQLARHFHFWRPQYSNSERRVRLQKRSGLSGAAACLIEARMDYMGQNPQSFLYCLKTARSHLQNMSKVCYSQKLKSALLIMMGYCAAYARAVLVDDSSHASSSRSIELTHEGVYLWRNWELDYECLFPSLSEKTRVVLEDWRTELLGSF